MTVSKKKSNLSFKSDLSRMDAHTVQPAEYIELPELDDSMMLSGVVNKGGRPIATNPRKLISLRLPADVIERWRATGSGWQTRMAERIGAP